jgi:hypothetical protein
MGVNFNPALPLLEATSVQRDVNQIVDRVFAMSAIAASTYGFDRQRATRWLSAESQHDELTDTERAFLETGTGNRHRFAEQIEGMWALAWSIQIVDELDFAKPCDDGFVQLLPDLKKMEPGNDFRQRASLRAFGEILSACDLAYCLHWAIVDAQLRQLRLLSNLNPAWIVERRRALEWLIDDVPWDQISLDT